jgi:hypothetical protein
METYNGHVRTPTDAIILFEACRQGILPRVQRRLSEKERQTIRSGSVFVWDEREAGMRRWTDGKSWSASRVSGSFLTYREMEGKRGGSAYAVSSNARGTKTPDSNSEADPSQNGEGEEGPDGYRYKPDGLMKQSFSITTSQGQHLHLISYYSRSHPTAQGLRQPSTDPNLASIQPAKGLYPESTINDQSSVPAVTRSPMVGVPNYAMSPSTPGYHRQAPASPHHHPYSVPPGYLPHYLYPISPLHTPPGHYAVSPYGTLPPGLPPIAYTAAPPYPPPPPGQPPMAMNHAPPSSYDQRPLRTSEPSGQPSVSAPSSAQPPLAPYGTGQQQPPLPPPPPPQPQQQHHPQPSAYQPAPSYDPAREYGGQHVQIDPRLTAALEAGQAQAQAHAHAQAQAQAAAQAQSQTNPPPQETEPAQRETRPPEPPTAANASQAPSITALVNDVSPLPKVERPPTNNGPGTNRPGSTSPKDTQNGAPPQDIPSEKLGFREDQRVLSKLDRVFARV